MEKSEKLKAFTSLNTALELTSVHICSDFVEALRAHDLAAAIEILERRLLDAPQDIAARLWWLRCQLESGGLPLSALSSPLEEITEGLRSELPLLSLAVSTSTLLGLQLLERSQSRLAIPLFTRALEFATIGLAAEQSSLNKELLSEVERCLREAYQAEIKRAEGRNEKKHYIESLKNELSLLGKRKTRREQEPNHISPPRHLFNSKSLLLQSEKEATSSPATEPAAPSAAGAEPKAKELTLSEEQLRKRNIYLLAALVALLLILLANLLRLGAKESDSLLVMNSLKAPTSQLPLPTLAPLAPSASYENLDTVKSRLENLGQNISSSGEVVTAGKDDAPTESSAENSTEPKEAATGDQSSAPTGSEGQNSSSLPNLKAEELARSTVEQLDQTLPPTTTVPVSPGQNVSSSAEKRSIAPPSSQKGSVELDGKPLRHYEVTRLNRPTYYRVLVETDVLQAPSVYARPTAHLKRNDKIKVVASMGRWLEIRSPSGKRGFIFAQDAEEQK